LHRSIWTSVAGSGDAIDVGLDMFGLDVTVGWELLFIYAVLVSGADPVRFVVDAVVFGVTVFQNVKMEDVV